MKNRKTRNNNNNERRAVRTKEGGEGGSGKDDRDERQRLQRENTRLENVGEPQIPCGLPAILHTVQLYVQSSVSFCDLTEALVTKEAEAWVAVK